MKRTVLVVALAAGALACDLEPDCPTKDGYNSCGYCKEDAVLSSNPHAGMCTYCTGTCVDSCDPCGDGSGGGCDTSWVSKCHTVQGGIEFVGQPVPKSCGCPSGTTQSGEDNVTAGGPYWICTCN